MDDSRRRRHDPEVVERTLSPLEELVALLVSLEFLLTVDGQGDTGVEFIDLDRVVDDQVAGNERIDLDGISSESPDRIPHRGEVDETWNAGEILKHDSCRLECDFLLTDVLRVIGGQGADMLFGDDRAVAVPEAGFEQDLDAVGKSTDVTEVLERIKAVNRPGSHGRVES